MYCDTDLLSATNYTEPIKRYVVISCYQSGINVILIRLLRYERLKNIATLYFAEWENGMANGN